jgi:hypothetical protein
MFMDDGAPIILALRQEGKVVLRLVIPKHCTPAGGRLLSDSAVTILDTSKTFLILERINLGFEVS